MSASAFLRVHGWKMRRGGWEHPRLPDANHDVGSALLQQAIWLHYELEDTRGALAVLQQAYFAAGTPTVKEGS